MNLYLLDLLYFYLCTLIAGTPLIPLLITLTGLSCINTNDNNNNNIIIIIIIIIININIIIVIMSIIYGLL